MEFDISYTNKEVTPWGGMVFLRRMLQKIGFRELIEKNVDLPQPGSNRGYETATIIKSFITSITFLLQEKTQKTLSTLRYRTFAVGAYFTKVSDKLVLKIALNKKRRAWFSGLWNYSKAFEYPFIFSNA